MSDYGAIRGVSTSLRRLLRDRMEDPVDVTIAPPDVTITDVTGRRLNLYLYQVSENSYLKNQDIPGHGHPGAFGHPPLSLDLHYLLTAHGASETEADADLDAQQILGDAMRVLHDFSTITDRLEITSQEVGTVGQPILDTSLLGSPEKVKITLQPLTLEDLSKLWTALPEANFRRSVAYQVSVVQIEAQKPRLFPRPVGEPPAAGPRVYTVSFRRPQIEEIGVVRQDDPDERERPFPYARVGDTLVIRGHNLAGEALRVILGAVDATEHITGLRDNRIAVIVPDNEELQPGPQPVKVVQDVMMGEPPEPHLGFQSNLAVFMLVPYIEELDATTTPGTLIIHGSRLFRENLECLTLVGDEIIRPDAYTTATSTEIAFNLPDLGGGDHAVRVRVNGAESVDDVMLGI